MTSTPLLSWPVRAESRRDGDPSTILVADLKRFWPSRRCYAYDELCR